MPRVRVTLPNDLLQRTATRAEEVGKPPNELLADAIARYIEVNKNVSAGSLRSRASMSRATSHLTVEVPEELFERAEKLAKRLGKKREVLYAEALGRHLAQAASGDSALNQGHDLPSGAWHARDSA